MEKEIDALFYETPEYTFTWKRVSRVSIVRNDKHQYEPKFAGALIKKTGKYIGNKVTPLGDNKFKIQFTIKKNNQYYSPTYEYSTKESLPEFFSGKIIMGPEDDEDSSNCLIQ